MVTTHIKMSVRNIFRHKGYSFINIAGLAVGMACSILIMLWVQDELSYDKFHLNRDRIFRVIQNINFADHSTTWAITQGPLGPALTEEFADIEDFTRVKNTQWRIRYNNYNNVDNGCFVDPSFFKMFSFKLIEGDPTTALANTKSVVVTQEFAHRLFGETSTLGKTIKVGMGDDTDLIICGILQDVPLNSHIDFDYLLPMELGKNIGLTVEQWTNSTFRTYVLLREGVSYREVVKKISGFLFEKPTIEEDSRLNLQPLTKIHLTGSLDFDSANGDIKYVYIFSIIAVIVLLIACVNFMNLTTAISANRAKEISMRKIAGAGKLSLIRQFFSETIILTLLALSLAIVLVEVALPLFNELSGKQIATNYFQNRELFLNIVIITLFTGIVSGIYPAVFLSSYQPIKVLKGKIKSGAKGSNLRKFLVVWQFTLSIALIIGTLVVGKQLGYMQNKKLGYNKENVIHFSRAGLDKDFA